MVFAISTVISSSVIKTPSCSNLLLPSITVSLLSSGLSDGFIVAKGEACSSLGVSWESDEDVGSRRAVDYKIFFIYGFCFVLIYIDLMRVKKEFGLTLVEVDICPLN